MARGVSGGISGDISWASVEGKLGSDKRAVDALPVVLTFRARTRLLDGRDVLGHLGAGRLDHGRLRFAAQERTLRRVVVGSDLWMA